MDLGLAGKTALVTGASSGVGKGVATALDPLPQTDLEGS